MRLSAYLKTLKKLLMIFDLLMVDLTFILHNQCIFVEQISSALVINTKCAIPKTLDCR